MTFPTIPTVAGGRILSRNQTDTSQTRTFPDLGSLTKNNGDLLIAIAVAYQSTGTANQVWSGWGGGFTEFGDSSTTTTCTIGMAYKFSDGTETGTFNVTEAAAVTGQASLILLSIPGARAAVTPEVAFVAGTGAIDPPSLNPAAWDVEDVLWIAVGVLGETSTSGAWDKITATNPTNYTGIHVVGTATDAVGAVDAAVAFRQLQAASEDPPTFTNDTSNTRWRAATIAVLGVPSPNEGDALLQTITWAGSATGARGSAGAATGTIGWAGTATGRQPEEGASTATLCRTTTSGVQGGPASGAIGWAGSATGARASSGAASGAVGWAGSATGQNTPVAPSWFTDGNGDPILISQAEDWGLLANGGLNNAGDYEQTYDDYFAFRAAQGFTAVYVSWCSFTGMNGGRNGPDWDNTYPFSTQMNPSTTPNETFWIRRDYFLASAAAAGVRVFLNLTTPYLHFGSPNTPPQRNWTTQQWTDFGEFLADRYGTDDNINWLVGDDYYDDINSGLDALLTALRAGGADQPLTIQYVQGSCSRSYVHAGATAWGDNADFNWGYTYNVSYEVVEWMATETAQESDPMPYGWFDGTFTDPADTTWTTRLVTHQIWWALSSGAKGFVVGDEEVWRWASTAWARLTSLAINTDIVPAIMAYFPSLPDWWLLHPDVDSALVTAGRGTHMPAGNEDRGPGEINVNTDSYVTASRTPDGTLAVIYLSHGATITIDESKMVADYTATWVDPYSCATSAATPGTTYNSTAKGNNSDGQPDWVLVLAGPPPPNEGSASGAVGWAGSATGSRASAGAASGTVGWAGSSTGARASAGSGSGAVGWAGTAVGGALGVAVGGIGWAGSSTGARASAGSATGAVGWVGSATGVRASQGAASGTVGWAGGATGARVSAGSAAGGIGWVGSSTGARASAGSATGAVGWVGSAQGANLGTASGAIGWAGSATGARSSTGSSTGAIGWVGTAVGGALGVGIGSISWAGSASGSRASSGSGSGAVEWAGTATGAAPSIVNDGAATGNVEWAGVASGARLSHGEATGTIGWDGTARGLAAASATGAIEWAGSASGTSPVHGAASGAVGWAGAASGARAPQGSGSGGVGWVGVALGADIGRATGFIEWHGIGHATGASSHYGAGTGTVDWSGSATGARGSSGSATGAVAWVGQAFGTMPSAFGPVTGLVATPVSTSEIDLEWDALAGAGYYQIERDGVIVYPFVVGTSWPDIGLDEGTQYCYRVRAVQ